MEILIFIIIIGLITFTFLFDLWLSILNYKNRNQPVPQNVSDIFEEDEYQKKLDYSMDNFRFNMVNSVVSFVIMIFLLLVGAFPYFKDVSESLSSNFHIQILIFLGIYFAISFVIGIITSYYDDFVIEEKYGFNKKTKKVFIIDKIKGFFLTVIFGGAFVFLLTTLYENFEVGLTFYVIALSSVIAIILFMNFFYVKLIIPIFNKLSPLEESTLKQKVEDFAIEAGYTVNKISIMNASKRSTKLNAFFTGFGKMKQVVFYDTLLDKLTEDEMVAILAHEIGHSKHKDLIFGLFRSIVLMAIFLAVLVFTLNSPILSEAFGFTDAHFGFGLIIFGVLLSPISILIELFMAGLTRKQEYQADEFARSYGYGLHLETALKVSVKENFTNLTPHPLYVKLKYSHPTVSSRIEAIRRNEKK